MSESFLRHIRAELDTIDRAGLTKRERVIHKVRSCAWPTGARC
jgi:hypothetical protein